MAAEHESVASVAAKVAPGVVAGGQPLFGYTLPEWAAIAGIVYTVVQLGFLLYDRYKASKEKANGCKL